MAHYLVTGGCGFIGSHLATTLLNAGHDVSIIDNLTTSLAKNAPNGAQLTIANINDREIVQKIMNNCEACFHLAAVCDVQETIDNWLLSHQTNVTGTLVLIDIAKEINKKRPFPIIFTSSAAVYGDCEKQLISENSPEKPLSPYGLDKLSAERHLQLAGALFNVPYTIIRLFNVYGRHPNKSKATDVISIFANKIRKNQSITVYGDGSQSRDFIYVTDVVNLLINALEVANPHGICVNACTSIATSINTLILSIEQILSIEAKRQYKDRRAGDIYYSLGDAHLAKELLKFEPQTLLKFGLKQCLDG